MSPAVDKRLRLRPAAVAGLFYPGNPEALREAVAGHLAAARAVAPGAVRAVIAPHAGYHYSGPVAGSAFAAVQGAASHIRRIVIIGPSHFVAFHGIACPDADAFATPLGQVALDRRALASVADQPGVVTAATPHAREHALEVELPFLQVLCPGVPIVPLVTGDAAPESVADVQRSLWQDEATLLVASSDLSHYHPYHTAQSLDEATAQAIEAFAWRSLGPEQACGWQAVAGLLILAAERGLAVTRLDLRNSGDTAGDRASVVGYGAWAFH
jgi:MEMO1 family protein